MRKQRSFNLEMGCFGLPESGKSDYAIRYILDLQQREQFYIIAHDAGYSIPRKLYDGRETGVIRYESAEDCALGLREDLKGKHVIHAITSPDAGETIALGKKVAWASLVKNTPGGLEVVKEGEGRGIPVIIYVDEIVRSQDANPHRLGQEMRELVACRRHFNCGFVFTSQSPHLCHYALGTQATDVVIFRLNDDEDVKRLYKRMNVPRETAEKAKTLKKHEHIHVKPGKY